MELYILNREFKIIDYIDTYISLEWNSKYNDVGDFVLNAELTPKNFNSLKRGNMLERADNDRIMIIEAVTATTTAQTGNRIKVKGRSIESILERRIIYGQQNQQAGDTPETFIRRMIELNAINPTDSKRKIDGLKLGALAGLGVGETFEKQATYTNLLDTIIEICKAYNYGFKITLNDNNEMIFDLYEGVDRSYNQEQNPYVVFSGEFENLINAEITQDQTLFANMAVIGGEGEGTERRYATIETTAAGLDRFEMFVDAKDISSNNGEIAAGEYTNMLIERGNEKMAEAKTTEMIDGEVAATGLYILGRDYNVGDIVQISNNIGLEATARVSGAIESNNAKGYRIVPTFENWE